MPSNQEELSSSTKTFQNLCTSDFRKAHFNYSELFEKLLPKKQQMNLHQSNLDFSFYKN